MDQTRMRLKMPLTLQVCTLSIRVAKKKILSEVKRKITNLARNENKLHSRVIRIYHICPLSFCTSRIDACPQCVIVITALVCDIKLPEKISRSSSTTPKRHNQVPSHSVLDISNCFSVFEFGLSRHESINTGNGSQIV